MSKGSAKVSGLGTVTRKMVNDELGDKRCQCHPIHTKCGERSLEETQSHQKDGNSMLGREKQRASNMQ